MIGQDLYDKWSAEMEERGIGVDTWGELAEIDKEAWNALATVVRPV